MRTLFNLLGPLSNPAGVTRALIGVADARWMDYIAKTMDALGAEKLWVAHGADGLDEITTTGPTDILELDGGRMRRFIVTPEEAGLARAQMADLRGGDPAHNAAACAPFSTARRTRTATSPCSTPPPLWWWRARPRG